MGSKTLSEVLHLIRSCEIQSPRQISIDNTNDCVMKSEQGVLETGSDPPSGHSVHTTAGDMWRALVCRKPSTKNLDPSPVAKNIYFRRVWGKSVGRRG